MNSRKILILGVTASGKGWLAFDLAKAIDGEIMSVDSMKVYRRMDIGTAKPDARARQQVRHHLIDVVEPSESFSMGRFLELAQQVIQEIANRGKSIIAVGGTALYIKALLYGLFEGPGSDEKIRSQLQQRAQTQGLTELHRELEQIDAVAAANIHPNDAKRIIRALEVHRITGKPISSLQKQFDADRPWDNWTIIGLQSERTEQNKRINARVKKMLEAGLVEEVKSLLAEERPLSKQARCAIGYAEIIDYLHGLMGLEAATELIKKNTRRLAKNQRTWFKTFKDVDWLDIRAEESTEQIFGRAMQVLEEKGYKT